MNDLQKITQMHRNFIKERDWERFQSPKNLSMALSVEASELAEIFMWLTEKQSYSLKEEQLLAASDEIADVFIYLLRIADVLGINLIEAANKKMTKNGEKYSVEKGKLLAQALAD